MDRSRSLISSETEVVHDVNHRFYRALETRDLAAMEALWLHVPFSHCVHPGRDALVGWPAIRESWVRLFSNTGWLRVTPTTLRVELLGDLAIVTCTENISSKSHDEVGLSVTAATNIFLRTEEGWRIFHHHASPAPVHVTHPFTGTIQ